MTPVFQGFYVNIVLCLGLTLLLTTLSNRDTRVRVFLFALALFFNVRYISWRASDTLPALQLDLATIWQWNFFFAEVVAVALLTWHILLLVFKPRDIDPSTGALAPDESPSVDVFIATYNEPRKLLKPTIQAAKRLEHDDVTVWVLDDGNRDWLETLCKRENVHYLRRTERKGYKAGNLNNALQHAKGDYILCLDADFIVHPHILKKTLGYFRDPKIGIVQTPQQGHGHGIHPAADGTSAPERDLFRAVAETSGLHT